MQNRHDDTSVSYAKERRMKRTIAALFLTALSIFGGFFYLQDRAAMAGYAPQAAPVNPVAARQQREASIAKANVLRSKWRPWAMQHQQILKQMLHAKPENRAALETVWNALPAWSDASNGGITDADLNAGGTQFSWNPVDRVDRPGAEPGDPHQWTAQDQKDYEQGKEFTATERANNFATHRDIVLSDSDIVQPQANGKGTSVLSFWASGRITEKTWIRQNIPGQPVIVAGTPQQLAPPYQFLQ